MNHAGRLGGGRAPDGRRARLGTVLAAITLLLALPMGVHAAPDRYGGDTSWSVRAAGLFRVERVRDRWWLITPEGRGLALLGLNHLNELKKPADFSRTTFARRLGSDWPRVFGEVETQIRSWGFNSAGFQAPAELRGTMPYILSTKFADASFWMEKLNYLDVFSHGFAADAERKAIAAAAEMKANPFCIAWTWNDSLCWDLALTRKSHGTDFVSFMRRLPPDSPGRIRYGAFLQERHRTVAALNATYGTNFASFAEVTRADLSNLDLSRAAVLIDDHEFLRLIARRYYEAIAAPFRREHPRGLLMGDRFHLRDHPVEVLEEAAKFIDVLGVQPGDHYQPSVTPLTQPDETWFDATEFDRLHRLTGKPIVVADHQCGFFDDQTPKTGGWHQYANAAEAADSYDRFLHAAFARPYVIGYFRCQYLTSYKDHTRRYKQGLLRQDGTPYEEFLARLIQTNREILRAYAAAP